MTYVNVKMSCEESRDKERWYWPGITRHEATEILKDHKHGDFLVRDATQENEYTIVVKKGHKVCSLHVIKHDGMYGLVRHRCVHPTIAALVRQMLQDPRTYKDLFPGIDFLHAVCRDEEEEEEEEKHKLQHLLIQLVNANKRLVLELRDYSSHMQRLKTVATELSASQTTVSSLQVVLQIFEEQLKSLKAAGTEEQLEEKTFQSVLMNAALISRRIQLIKDRQQSEEGKLFNLQCEGQFLEETTGNYKHRLLLLKTEQQRFRRKVEKNVCKTYVDLLLRDEDNLELRHFGPDAWLVECDRLAAEAVLAPAVPGTFLIRPKDSRYVLSIVCAHDDTNRIHHIQIHHADGQGYGFIADFCIFPTLEDLVTKHRTISLHYYGFNLDVCLTCPIGCKDNSG
ncbi:phosphatidylinositol 3-kinase regulatory subunit alpha-like isoform X1 [Pomacea canaliculata]|nr:phosphatidylinositol 3-kinase regulatory subunit alpha-like isoform X1 [Pomacea canaliculata]